MAEAADLDAGITDDRRRKKKSMKPKLACYWLGGAGFPAESERTLLITGVARSGTSFASSAVRRLGVPMERERDDWVSGHGEHVPLREAFQAKDATAFERIVTEFNARHPIWGWKLPSMRNDLDWVSTRVRNPCYVLVFKEPISVAMRKISTGHQDDLAKHCRKILKEYQAMVEFAMALKRPVLLVSYDKALRQLDECLDAFARFGGVASYDLPKVKAGIEQDAGNY